MNDFLLRVKNLKTHFRTVNGIARAVDGVSFEIQRNEVFALVGESGCGKSVTALSIIQLVPQPAGFAVEGEIYLGDQEITGLPETSKRKIRGNEIAMIFQEPMTSLNPVFTIGNQISEVFKHHQGMRGQAVRNATIEMLDLVGIPDATQRFYDYPHQLSGGMQQRVMIAIALSCRPKLLIADEPTTALDVTVQAQILELIKRLQRELDMAVLLISHDLGVVYNIADRVGLMYAGKIVEMSDCETLYRDPRHPYTRKLLESLPSRQKRGVPLQTIAGLVPKATNYPDGCRFVDRCSEVMADCDSILPPDIEVGYKHQVACNLFNSSPPFNSSSVANESLRQLKNNQFPEPFSKSHSSKSSPLVQVKDLRVHFPVVKGFLKRTVGYVHAVDDVELTIERGKTLALVGESGCGKTTLSKAILRLGVPVTGKVLYEDVNLVGLKRTALHSYRKRLQIIFQDPYSSLNPRMTVGDIIEEGMQVHKLGLNAKNRKNRVKTLMQQVGLSSDMAYLYPHEFSGGQRQRIGIARCLAVEPEFIICDEATSALDVSVQAQILNLLKELQVEFNLSYLFITHNLSVVEYLADELVVMYLGRIVERGATEEIFDNPKHPYTRMLLSAVPKIDPETGAEKICLEGDLPSPVNPPMGCHFHPRCSHVMPYCHDVYPSETTFTKTHACRCHLYNV